MQPGSWLALGFGDSINSDDPTNIDMLRFIAWECDCEDGPWEEFVYDMHKINMINFKDSDDTEGWDIANVFFEEDDNDSNLEPNVEDAGESGIDGGYHWTSITAKRPF